MSQDVEIRHYAVDELPGGAAAIWEVGPKSITVVFSRAVSVDEIVASSNAAQPAVEQALQVA